MQLRNLKILIVGVALGVMLPATAQAADVLCQDVSLNHMLVSDAYVSACVEAGVGNIGNGKNDDFLATAAGAGYVDVGGGSFVQTNDPPGTINGTFSFASSLWNTYSSLAIGFKFGTGNDPDEWFIYTLQSGVSSGTWEFVHGPNYWQGGGLSHVELYTNGVTVPEPATLGLLALGLLGFGFTKRQEVA